MKVLRNILAALVLAGLGAYVLRSYPGTIGLCVGAGAVLLSLCIALPTQIHEGVESLKGNLVLIVPVIVGALKGGDRKTDPPAE